MPQRCANTLGPAPKEQTPMQGEDYAPATVARFWLKVVIGEWGCWEWTASKRGDYGQFGLREGVIVPAHRYAYEYLVSPIPDGLVIDHLCRNTVCVNPEHLEPVTNVENIMRGESRPARNARKMQCVHGHRLSGVNLYVAPGSGKRQCRICRKAQARKHKATYAAKKRAEGAALERLLATTDLRSAPDSVKAEISDVIHAKHDRERVDD